MENYELIEKEFNRLRGQTYLDHAGSTLYAESQINDASKDLTNNLYLNPHTSKHTSDSIDQIRFQVLRHFNTDSKEYTIIFTSGSTAALKLVAESFEFGKRNQNTSIKHGSFIHLQDNHTSVLGMREIALSKSADVICIPHKDFIKTLSEKKTNNHANGTVDDAGRALFIYPAMCNFSGYKYPLEWIKEIKNRCLDSLIDKPFSSWSIMLDTAAFVSTNMLDLSKYKPDFLCVSFYKMFGFPTGIGALIVRNDSAHLLNDKIYYGGGTVEMAMSSTNYHVKRKKLHERFEDGTIPFLSILALKHGFDTLSNLIPKHIVYGNTMDAISQHTFHLAKVFYHKLKSLKHFNDKPVVFIYSDTEYEDVTKQGGIVNFNLLRANGDYIGYSEVTFMSQLFNIHIRSGCFCNPGACQRFLKLSDEDVLKHHNAGHICGDNNDMVDGQPTGSLRVSFGYMSTEKDVENFVQMITKCFIENGPRLTNCFDTTDILNNISVTNGGGDCNQIPIGVLREINIFPLKSCKAFKVCDSWEIGPKGFKFDREWMIVTETGVALSQKQDTRICLISPSIDLDENKLILSFPGIKDIKLPLETDDKSLTESSLCHSKVCGDRIMGYDCGDGVASWLLEALGIPGLRLIKQTDEDIRTFKKKNQETSDEIKPISLTNQAQYLVINLASVKWLADKVESGEFHDKIDNLCDRFRGNLIVETKRPFEEFSWSNIHIGKVNFQVDGPCRRCQMVCIDQETGDKTVEPLRTISKQFEGKLNFGVYLSHQDALVADSTGDRTLRCGDVLYNNQQYA